MNYIFLNTLHAEQQLLKPPVFIQCNRSHFLTNWKNSVISCYINIPEHWNLFQNNLESMINGLLQTKSDFTNQHVKVKPFFSIYNENFSVSKFVVEIWKANENMSRLKASALTCIYILFSELQFVIKTFKGKIPNQIKNTVILQTQYNQPNLKSCTPKWLKALWVVSKNSSDMNSCHLYLLMYLVSCMFFRALIVLGIRGST